MKIVRDLHKFQKEMTRLRRRGKTIGFVPTMGALHEGHLSLVRKARKENQIVVVSIFVNPLQFGPREDLRRYPRTIAQDRSLLGRAGADYIFAPSARSLYPHGFQTFIEVTDLSRGLCGRLRPGHFRGVATVVTKLFNLARPHRAYFGLKDYQQAMMMKRVAADLNFDLEVRLLPLLRDRNGMALSSRNAYLSSSEKERALSISRSLRWAGAEIHGGNRNLQRIRSGMLRMLRPQLDKIDYVEFVEPETLKPLKSIRGRLVIALAGWVGKTRLIDNVIMRP